MKHESERKRVCITICQKEYERLSRLAEDAARTPAGYLCWLLHQHFRKLDSQKDAGE